MPKERNNKLTRRINKLLEILPITQRKEGLAPHLQAIKFHMTGARVDPETKEVLLVLKAKD